MTTMIDSLRDGNWIRDGYFALLLGVSLYFRLASLLFRHIFSLQRMAMSSFRVSVMGGD